MINVCISIVLLKGYLLRIAIWSHLYVDNEFSVHTFVVLNRLFCNYKIAFVVIIQFCVSWKLNVSGIGRL